MTMVTAPVSYGVPAAATATSSETDTDQNPLDKNAFLLLLVTELQNQDPMEPMKDREFIAQMAQFSSLEQMQNLNATMDSLRLMEAASQAASLIGRQVTLLTSDGSDTISGIVESVHFQEGVPEIVVDGSDYSLGQVMEVR
jgi:flagellar basal-body rod modification protein FlgD